MPLMQSTHVLLRERSIADPCKERPISLARETHPFRFRNKAGECRYKAALASTKWKGTNKGCNNLFPIHYK